MTRRPTLLVFTLGPEAERARRPLLPAEHGRAEVELRRGCLEAAVGAGREAGCRVVVSAPRDLPRPDGVELQHQDGDGFGDRLERACRDAARAAAGRQAAAAPAPLIVVGTDVPGLRARHLRQAAAALEADPDCVVLGPSPDGGFYLLATARPLPGLATLTRWCRRDTLDRLRRSLARAGRRTVLLEPLRDLDRRCDLERWIAEGPPALPRHRGRQGGRRRSRPVPHPAPPAHEPPLVPWRSLLRHLARLLAALRRPSLRLPFPALAPLPGRVRSPRAPPR